MIEVLNKLVERAIAENQAGRFPGAESIINGKRVEAYIAEQYRRTTNRKQQKPSVMWKVDGKRVAFASLSAAIQG